jgi:hypothetical protein
MTVNDEKGGPFIDFGRENSPESVREIVSNLKKAFAPPPPPPIAALDLLFKAARGDTGGSQATRHFLFWLVAQPDPTGFNGQGGLELRRLDGEHRQAALEVLGWWGGPTKSDEPLYSRLRVLADLYARAKPSSAPEQG